MGACCSSEQPPTADARDVLLNTIFPEHVKDYLLQHLSHTHLETEFDFRKTLEEHHDVTIMFFDICGFTRMSQDAPPHEVARFLHSVYLRIDTAIEKYPSIRKIETIGDCIMLAEGLFVSNENRSMEFAKEVVRTVSTLSHKGAPVEMRIGIHCGPVASGVVGIRTPRFCLFGNAVNVAARLQGSARPGEIHMSSEFNQRIDNSSTHGGSQSVVCNGDVHLKGMDPMKTFSGIYVKQPSVDNNELDERTQCTDILRILYKEGLVRQTSPCVSAVNLGIS
jgi:class 3 adenylate cyclase